MSADPDRPPRAWVLNLDAEYELEAGKRFTASRQLIALVARQRALLVSACGPSAPAGAPARPGLLAPGDIVVTEASLASGAAAAARGLPGAAWSPTPRALSLLQRAGARLPQAPPAAVLRAVNERAFTIDVRAPLSGASFDKYLAADLDAALDRLARPAPNGWLARRSFGAAGRGRRRIASGRPSAAERAWLAASLRRGPLVIEPWVEIVTEYTRSGFVDARGAVSIAAPCFQAVRDGAWVRTQRADRGELQRSDDDRLAAATAAAGEALAQAGYFGPFGIDAYRHRDPRRSAASALNVMSEINARYTMDWANAWGTAFPAGSAQSSSPCRASSSSSARPPIGSPSKST